MSSIDRNWGDEEWRTDATGLDYDPYDRCDRTTEPEHDAYMRVTRRPARQVCAHEWRFVDEVAS
jgi:hypothetical protein